MNPSPTPGAVIAYRIFAAFMVLLYLSISAALALLLTMGRRWMSDAVLPIWFYQGYWGWIGIYCFALAGLYLASLFLPKVPGTWTFHMILICLSFASTCVTLIALPLLFFYLQPKPKAYFGKD